LNDPNLQEGACFQYALGGVTQMHANFSST